MLNSYEITQICFEEKKLRDVQQERAVAIFKQGFIKYIMSLYVKFGQDMTIYYWDIADSY